MALIVKPISAQLVKDYDLIGKSVLFYLFRTLTVSFLWDIKNKEREHVKVEEKNPTGQIPFHLTLEIKYSRFKCGMMIHSGEMILLVKEL